MLLIYSYNHLDFLLKITLRGRRKPFERFLRISLDSDVPKVFYQEKIQQLCSLSNHKKRDFVLITFGALLFFKKKCLQFQKEIIIFSHRFPIYKQIFFSQ